jgi:transposase
MSKPKSRRRYTKDFKLEAVHLATTHEGSVSEVAQGLGIGANMLYRWISEYEADNQNAFPGLGKLRDGDDELRKLRRELAETKMERDILKKALSIFSRQNPKNTDS